MIYKSSMYKGYYLGLIECSQNNIILETLYTRQYLVNLYIIGSVSIKDTTFILKENTD